MDNFLEEESKTPQPEEQWKGVEEYDTYLIVSDDNETEVYWHSNSQKYDYTKNGWNRLAIDNNLSIVSLDIVELDDKYQAKAAARRYVRLKGVEEVVEMDRISVHEEKKIQFGKEDPYAFTKAAAKATRNAFKEHLRGHSEITQEKLESIFKAQNNGKDGPQVERENPRGKQGNRQSSGQQRSQQQSSQQRPKQEQPPAQEQSERLPQDTPPAAKSSKGRPPKNYYEKKVAEMWATYTEYKEVLEAMGIDQEAFKQGLYVRFETDSTTKMTAEQHLDVTKGLRFVSSDGSQFAQWIRDMGSAAPNLVDGDDVPFGDDKPCLLYTSPSPRDS